MGDEWAIQVSNLTKWYALHHRAPQGLKAALLWHREPVERHRVLSDVSFTVARGESVGLTGPNGSGKSTLLKVVAGILEPDEGTVRTNGRVCALLELGAGFHPELSGRENVYLSGSIMGFRRRDLDNRMGEIIAFSELEGAIDAPVRTYSSGMYVRLGFSLALHARPDVLLIDEILAVGDAGFQRRCLDHIETMKRNGTAILFVSHDMNAVCRVCDRAVMLEEGVVVEEGSSGSVAERYEHRLTGGMEPSAEDLSHAPFDADPQASSVPTCLSSDLAEEEATSTTGVPSVGEPGAPGPSEEELRHRRYFAVLDELQRKRQLDLHDPARYGSGLVRIEDVRFRDASGREVSGVTRGESLGIEFDLIADAPERVVVGVGFHTVDGIQLSGPNLLTDGLGVLQVGRHCRVRVVLPEVPWHSGEVLVSLAVYDAEVRRAFDHWHKRLSLRIYPRHGQEAAGVEDLHLRWSFDERP